MRLSSDDGLGRLEVEVHDLDLHAPRAQLGLLVRAKIHGYAGEEKVWVALTDLTRFAQELEAIELVPNGAAVLDGLTPEQLNLTVLSPEDDVGCVTHVSLSHRQKVGGREYETSVAGAFTLPPDAIRLAAKTFRRWCDPKFLSELADWGFDEKAMLDD